MKPLVYTAIFNHYDMLRTPLTDNEARFVCYADGLDTVPPPWEIATVDYEDDPQRASRKVKILSHEQPADITIWHGGNVQLLGSIDALVACLGDSDIAVLKHEHRDCVYDEADVCSMWGKDDPDVIMEQMARYRQDGYPCDNGLSMCFLIVRRNTDSVKALNEMWWHEVETSSVRDQLSFDYCCWKLGIVPATIPGGIYRGPHHRRFPEHAR